MLTSVKRWNESFAFSSSTSPGVWSQTSMSTFGIASINGTYISKSSLICFCTDVAL
jgi:hypothetical protein